MLQFILLTESFVLSRPVMTFWVGMSAMSLPGSHQAYSSVYPFLLVEQAGLDDHVKTSSCVDRRTGSHAHRMLKVLRMIHHVDIGRSG